MRRVLGAGLGLLLLLLVSCGAFKRCAYEGFGRRDAWQQPERVVEVLKLEPGQRVADLGAGGGYFTFRLADAVGESGLVYAVDVDPEMVEHLALRAGREGYAHVRSVLASSDDPQLPDGEIDLVFMANTYHHLQERSAYFRKLQGDLAPAARVAILDYDAPGFLRSHYSERQEILDEMAEAGYRLAAEHDFIDRQSFVIFEVCEPDAC